MTSLISSRDYTLIIDRSGSMGSPVDSKDVRGQTLWQAAAESTEAVAREILKLDPDGITVYVFSTDFRRFENVSSAEMVRDIFQRNQPQGVTNLAEVLKHALDDYFKRRKHGEMAGKTGETILVVTDGAPNSGKSRRHRDEEKVIKAIVSASKKVKSQEELAISFFQIGNEPAATEFLKRLDDDLVSKHKAKFDIVDTKTFEEIEDIGLTQALIEAITD